MAEKTRSTTRRGNGEGSIFHRCDGVWVGKISAGYDGNGRRMRRSVYGSTKREVQDKLLDLQHRKRTGALAESSKVTVSQYLVRWLDDVARLTVRPSTHRRYKELIRLHIDARIGGVRLHRLTAGDIQGAYSGMEESKLSPRTRQFVHTVLRRALDNAVRWGLVSRNVCDQVTPPRVQHAPMQVLTPEQASKFLAKVQDDRLCAMYVLAIAVGMRQGELMGLQWANIDLAAGWLSVSHTLNDDGTLGEPKTTKSRRRIELPAIAVDALWAHKQRMLVEGNASSPFVFCDTHGGPLRRQNVQRRSFRPALKATGLPTIRFHDLRHTAATLMLAGGVHAKVVQEVLGHATIAITLDTYSHVLPSMQRDAAERMNRMLSVATA